MSENFAETLVDGNAMIMKEIARAAAVARAEGHEVLARAIEAGIGASVAAFVHLNKGKLCRFCMIEETARLVGGVLALLVEEDPEEVKVKAAARGCGAFFGMVTSCEVGEVEMIELTPDGVAKH